MPEPTPSRVLHPENRLDHCLAFHCAPAIAGIKVANLVSLHKNRFGALERQCMECESLLKGKGVRFFRLDECTKRVLLLVYNQRQLARRLMRAEYEDLLLRHGYDPRHMTLPDMLERLSRRIQEHQGAYPHEIGVFLGYPAEDVQGFIHNHGVGYKLCGYWKVYGDPGRAKRLFRAYDTARSHYCACVSKGEQIHTIHYGGTDYEQGSGHLLVGNR